jgi:NTE family protein
LCLYIGLFTAQAQKVAVVLSGGGAKGVTHIGVLKALEDNGIPVDYIAGTSMGAIIGGLYASGYSPDEMEQIINSNEFAKWVSGKLDDQYTYFFRQGQANASWLSFKFKYDSTLQTQLPTNIISPLRMDFAFLELFSQSSAAAGYNFDNLMVPFRCVAADVQNNQTYILKSGDLGSAIRASMTFPFYFKPIRIDGKLLFDGGMYNNFPSDVALEHFNPDIIIGSKAAKNYHPPDEDDVISQLATMLMEQTKYTMYCDASVLIEPNLKYVSLIDFSNTQAFIDSGYIATVRLIPEIRKFVVDTISKQKHDSIRMAFNVRKPAMKVNSVEVDGLEKSQALYVANAIIGQVNSRKGNSYYAQDLNIDEVKSGYFKVLGEERLKSAYPTLWFDTTTRRYKFKMVAKYEKGISANFGGSLSSGGSNEIFLQLQYSHWRKVATMAKINGFFGRFYNSALVGGRIEIPSRKPKFFETEYTFNQFNYFRSRSFFFIDETPLFLYENNHHLRMDMGFPLTYKGKIEVGLTLGSNHADYFQTNTATQDDKADETKFTFYSPYIEIEFNTLNRKQFSNKGYRLFAALHFVGGVEKHIPGSTSGLKGDYSGKHNYLTAKFVFDKYFRDRKVYRPGFSFEFNVNNIDNFRNYTSTTLYMPAYSPIYEMLTIYQPVYRPLGFSAIGMRNVLAISKNIDFRIEGFLIAPFREISSGYLQQVVRSDYFPALHALFSTSFIYNTPIGPLSSSLNWYDDGTPVSFFINLGFIIFNRSAF